MAVPRLYILRRNEHFFQTNGKAFSDKPSFVYPQPTKFSLLQPIYGHSISGIYNTKGLLNLQWKLQVLNTWLSTSKHYYFSCNTTNLADNHNIDKNFQLKYNTGNMHMSRALICFLRFGIRQLHISFRDKSLALRQSFDLPHVCESSPENWDEWIKWIHKKWPHSCQKGVVGGGGGGGGWGWG